METVLEYIMIYVPTIVAVLCEVGVVKWALNMLAKAKETKEFKAIMEQNKILINELREAKRLNKELLTKIDHIKRGDEDNTL